LGFNIESVSQFFGPNDIIAFVESGLIRPAGLLKDYEIFAEIAVVLAFMSIFLYFFTRKFKYVLYFIVFLSGALITLTRSFLIMLIIGIILHLFIPFTSSGKKIKIIITLFCFFLILYLGLYHFTPSLINNFVDRINEISILLNYDVSTEELINRQQVHEPFQFLLIGNGTRFEKIQFHSLYLTLNYQIGTLGLISFLIFISLIFFNAFKTILTTYNNKQKLTISYLALVFILILINEYKIEFVRYSFSTEFTWLMLGLLYKVANDPFVFDNELKL
jgi:4-amino-4-deoxy-L-arabinose transferase-like glycosyltransferase